MSYLPESSDGGGRFVVAVFVAATLVCFAVYLVASCNDCDARGGVLVESALGGYECVEKKP